MKNIYIYGIITRLFYLNAFMCVIFLSIYDMVVNGVKFIYILIIPFIFIVFTINFYHQWTAGLFVDKKRNKIKLSFDINKKKDVLIEINNIKKIEISMKKGVRKFDFLFFYMDGTEEVISYVFFANSWTDSFHYKGLRKRINKLNKYLNLE